MTEQDEIIGMARQAGFYNHLEMYFDDEMLEAFANLVTKKVEARYMQLFLDPENQPTQFGTATQEYREQEIIDEREACAKYVESLYVGKTSLTIVMNAIADGIRARGEACPSNN